jgi:hypothetical protein
MKNSVSFEIIGEIEEIETIAIAGGIRDILHWYEAHGIGRKKMKIKRFLD